MKNYNLIMIGILIIILFINNFNLFNNKEYFNENLSFSKPSNWDSLSFNQKLKIYSKKIQNPEYAYYTDKYEVKNYIKNLKIEDLHYAKVHKIIDLNETLIDLKDLPKDCVIKSNNGWNDIIIIKNNKIEKMIMRGKKLSNDVNNYNTWRQKVIIPQKGKYEDHYRYMKPVIFVEEYLGDKPNDYKFYCFHGEIKIIDIVSERFNNYRANTYDKDLNILPYSLFNKRTNLKIKIPNNFEKMKKIAEELARKYEFARIDLYDINGKIYFGEITFTPFDCSHSFQPNKYDYLVGSYWK